MSASKFPELRMHHEHEETYLTLQCLSLSTWESSSVTEPPSRGTSFIVRLWPVNAVPLVVWDQRSLTWRWTSLGNPIYNHQFNLSAITKAVTLAKHCGSQVMLAGLFPLFRKRTATPPLWSGFDQILVIEGLAPDKFPPETRVPCFPSGS